jgi:hypothetical protein
MLTRVAPRYFEEPDVVSGAEGLRARGAGAAWGARLMVAGQTDRETRARLMRCQTCQGSGEVRTVVRVYVGDSARLRAGLPQPCPECQGRRIAAPAAQPESGNG